MIVVDLKPIAGGVWWVIQQFKDPEKPDPNEAQLIEGAAIVGAVAIAAVGSAFLVKDVAALLAPDAADIVRQTVKDIMDTGD